MFKKIFEKKSSKDQDNGKKDHDSTKEIGDEKNANPINKNEGIKIIEATVESSVIGQVSNQINEKSSVDEAINSDSQAKGPVKIILNDSEINLENLKTQMTPTKIFIFAILISLFMFAIFATAYLLFGVFLN
jgi:hypothetical protein